MDDLIVFLIIVLLVLGIASYNNAIAAEKATIHCQERGFDQYKTYNRVMLGNTPYGIKCEYAPRSLQTTISD